jgi:hypothetical protein
LLSSAGSATAPASVFDCLRPRASEDAHVVPASVGKGGHARGGDVLSVARGTFGSVVVRTSHAAHRPQPQRSERPRRRPRRRYYMCRREGGSLPACLSEGDAAGGRPHTTCPCNRIDRDRPSGDWLRMTAGGGNRSVWSPSTSARGDAATRTRGCESLAGRGSIERARRRRMAGRPACFGRFSSRRPLLRAPRTRFNNCSSLGRSGSRRADTQMTDWQPPPWSKERRVQSPLPRCSVAQQQQQRRRPVATRPDLRILSTISRIDSGFSRASSRVLDGLGRRRRSHRGVRRGGFNLSVRCTHSFALL